MSTTDNNAITVNAARMPGRITPYAVPTGSTVADVLTAAELSTDGFDIRLDGSEAEPTDIVVDSQTILLVRKVKGNAIPRKFAICEINGRSYALYID